MYISKSSHKTNEEFKVKSACDIKRIIQKVGIVMFGIGLILLLSAASSVDTSELKGVVIRAIIGLVTIGLGVLLAHDYEFTVD